MLVAEDQETSRCSPEACSEMSIFVTKVRSRCDAYAENHVILCDANNQMSRDAGLIVLNVAFDVRIESMSDHPEPFR